LKALSLLPNKGNAKLTFSKKRWVSTPTKVRKELLEESKVVEQ